MVCFTVFTYVYRRGILFIKKFHKIIYVIFDGCFSVDIIFDKLMDIVK